MSDLNAVPGAFRGLAAIDVVALKQRIGGRLVVASVSGKARRGRRGGATSQRGGRGKGGKQPNWPSAPEAETNYFPCDQCAWNAASPCPEHHPEATTS